jgi:integrase
MGSILERPRADGTIAYLAKIAIMREGKVVHRESRTFDRRPAAVTWIDKRERDLAKPGGLVAAQADNPTLAMAIERYITTSRKKIGKTKAQVLQTVKGMDIAQMRCSEIKSHHLVELAETLSKDRQPQTVGNYMSHLGSVFSIAKHAWSMELDASEMEGAAKVNKRLGLTSKSKQRSRRPTLKELDKLMTHFGVVEVRRAGSTPMQKVILFAIFSTRRQEEITRIRWADRESGRVLVRDMKHPGDKAGNDTWCDLVPEAELVIDSMPKVKPEIFPASADTISAAFTRACYATGINTETMPDEDRLHFHDLRHDGVSRLFEMGWNIPHVAAVSGHRSWQSLKRYTHLRQAGDKYANWKWLEIVRLPS